MKWPALVATVIVLSLIGWQAWPEGGPGLAPVEAPLVPGEAPKALVPMPGDLEGGSQHEAAHARKTAKGVDATASTAQRVQLTRLVGSEHDGPSGITGRVDDADGEPVAGLVVRAVQRTRGGESSLGQTRTDGSGEYVLSVDLGALASPEFPSSSEWFDLLQGDADSSRSLTSAELAALYARMEEIKRQIAHVGRIVVSVEDALGFRAEAEFRSRPGERHRRVDLRILREYRFGGEVLDGVSPAPFANVMLFDAERELVATTDSDIAGKFELTVPPAGRFELHARAIGHGAGALNGVSLGPEQRSLPQTIALGGDGVLRGRILYPGGDPVAGLEVHGALGSLASRNPERPLFPTPVELLEEERDGGLALSSVRTTEDGRFRMVGMQPGSYQLLFDSGESGVDPPGLFSTGPEHALRLKASRIRVSLISGDNRKTRAVSVHCLQADWRRVQPGVAVQHEVAVSSDGVAQFLMPSEFDWIVFAELGGQRSQEVAVEFRSRPGDGSAVIDLTPKRWTSAEAFLQELTPEDELARLQFVVRDPQGEPVKSHLWLWRLEDDRLAPLHVKRVVEKGRGIPALRAGSFRYRLQLAEREGELWLPSKRIAFDLAPGSDDQLEVQARPVLDLRMTLVANEGAPPRSVKDSAFQVELVTGVDANGETTRTGSRKRRRGGVEFGIESRLLVLGEEVRVLLQRPAGAYRLRLTGMGEYEERFECSLPLRDDQANRFELVLTDR